MSEPKQLWACPACRKVYQFRDSAADCCSPAPAWACGECDSRRIDKASAEQCCDPDSPIDPEPDHFTTDEFE